MKNARLFAEYEFTATSSKTGRRIHQLIFGRLVSESGKIKCLREALDRSSRICVAEPPRLRRGLHAFPSADSSPRRSEP